MMAFYFEILNKSAADQQNDTTATNVLMNQVIGSETVAFALQLVQNESEGGITINSERCEMSPLWEGTGGSM